MQSHIEIRERVKVAYQVVLDGRVVAEVATAEKASSMARNLAEAKARKLNEREPVLAGAA